jgi:hypothetical protein
MDDALSAIVVLELAKISRATDIAKTMKIDRTSVDRALAA